MILERLNELYGRLLTQYDEAGSKPVCLVPTYGFSDEKIGYFLVLDENGCLRSVQPNRFAVTKGKKTQDEDRRVRVPCAFGRSGKFTEKAFSQGKNIAFFLWDKPEFLLGVTLNDKKVEIADLPFRAFRARHVDLIGASLDKGLQAVVKFLKNWDPKKFSEDSRFTPEMLNSNFTFKLEGDLGIIAEREAATEIWRLYWDTQKNPVQRQCLIRGEIGSLAETHPMLKVPGGQTSGVAIVTYNESAYESLGKSQGDNAPVSEQAAFAYTTALNYMLRRENGHCLSIGDSSTVFWAQAKTSKEEVQAVSFFSAFANPPTDDGQATKLGFSLEKIAKGRPFEEITPDLDPSTRFYVLGVAPNAARLSIRYWLDSSLGVLAQRIREHWLDMQIEPQPWQAEKPPSIQKLLLEVVPLRKKDGRYDYMSRKLDDIPPRLAGDFLRSILTGQRYPRALLTQIVQRLRTDGDINGLRVALIKAVLQRDHRKGFLKEGVPMSLDLENAPLAYRLGCLFAVLAKAQSDAIPGANATIVDRYYGTASSVPYSVFPRLIAGFQNHISKLRKSEDTKGWAVNHERQMNNILATLSASFPKQLTIEQQGQFAVGYYHQRQSFIVKKSDASETESTPST